MQDGHYEFAGRRYQLALTEPEQQNAIHGLVRWAAWKVGEHEPDRVVMEHVSVHSPAIRSRWPSAVEYLLSDAGLRVRATATNTAPIAAPSAPARTRT